MYENKIKTLEQKTAKDFSESKQEAGGVVAIAPHHSIARIQRKANNTGLPDNLKSGIEQLSGHSMDDVKVHFNSSKPTQLQAHAYTQGTDIHVAPGQEKHLPHEAWHVVQQKQGRVRSTMQMRGKVNVNDEVHLEREADVMGAKATAGIVPARRGVGSSIESDPIGCIGCAIGFDSKVKTKTVPTQRKATSVTSAQMVVAHGVNAPTHSITNIATHPARNSAPIQMQLRRRRRAPEPPPEPVRLAPPGRPYRHSRDNPNAHGPRAWGSTLGMMVGGMIHPALAFDVSAARNSAKDFSNDIARAHIDRQNGNHHNARLSEQIAALEAARTVTATPVGHVISHAISHAAAGVNGLPAGDAGWYGAAGVQDRLFRRMKKLKAD